ncbi:DNA helicase [Heracleum sosnowskyi]|uniref:DNA 3'-5' helicase n=1 Tax=Heracleum sosnowskyi TaxID=360622 RepID=A0AAD8NCC5_9APIA|nr:DNA helicase [Heracleum sosnowskyi]
MNSDSDSGGSYISATPPRHSSPPPPPQPPPRHSSPPQPPAARSNTLSLKNCRPKSKTKLPNTSRPILRPKPKKYSAKPNPIPVQPDPLPSSSIKPVSLQDLPFRIIQPCSFDQCESEEVSANRLSVLKFGSFSKKNVSCLNFEAIEDDKDCGFAPSGSIKGKSCFSSEFTDNDKDCTFDPSVSINPKSCSNFESTENDKDCTFAPSGPIKTKSCLNFESAGDYKDCTFATSVSKDEVEKGKSSVCTENVVRPVRKHPNLISSSGDFLQPVKKAKCSNEGNFVRLNINGYGRSKFTYKTKNRNYKSSRRRNKNWNVKGNGGEEGEFVEEEGLVFEKKEDVKGSEKVKGDFEVLVEEAVLSVRNEASDENLVKLLKLTHGFNEFRDGQLEAIKTILDGKSIMLVLPTGAGKSLCYQLASLVLPGITLVVSPLIALMIDQLKQLPPAIPGGLISSSQTREETEKTLRLLQEGALKVLFVSPERFLSKEFISVFSSGTLVSLAVIDEAHCISEWSHNFRPSYMRLRASLLRDSLNVKSILAMTATATKKTLLDVMSALDIPPTNLIQAAQLRENFQLSVSLSENRMKHLTALLRSSPYKDITSIIVYCKYKYETDTISKFLADGNIKAKSYHSGLTAKERSRTQELFCSNKIRVVVATVAFGMGLDKSDVGAVIHYSLPESLEEYVQEIGRAGRDGRLSFCHLLFDDITYYRLRSLMYSDGLDEYAVNKFLRQVFSSDDFPGKVCSLPKESLSRKFDMKEEVMLTILTRLELGEVHYLHLLPEMNVTCCLNFYKTPPAVLASKDIFVSAIMKKSVTKDGKYVFDIPTVASSMHVQLMDLTNQLQYLKLKGEVTYELKDPAYCYTILNSPKDVCSLTEDLTKWLLEVESCKVKKLDAMYNAAVFAVKECDKMLGCNDCTPFLQKKILEYFAANDGDEIPNKMGQSSRFLRSDIKVFLQSNNHAKFTPRAIARIMHGIASPAFPSAIWSRTHFWGRYAEIEFKAVMEAAKAELLNIVGKDII